MTRIGPAERINDPSVKLSCGPKQPVSVARALMIALELLLADEPTGNLGRESELQVMELIGQINCN